MTLRRMLQSHDDTALAALTSKGLLRRASRDLQAGVARVDSLTDAEAVLSVGDEKTTLLASGPKASTCSCKAAGVCRHILLAILLLREQLPASAETDDEAVPGACEKLCAASVAQLQKFAGADWDKALALNGSEPDCRVDERAPNVTVQFPELDATITFIAASEWKDAIYKGPKTRQRLLTTVAALQVRLLHGLRVSDDAPATSGVSARFIDDAQAAIERAVAATLPGRSATSLDMLLDLAISSRCETLPRLSAELRGLARESQRACERHADFDSAEFLLQASRSYALLEALRHAPNDPQLTGTLRRDYQKTDAIELWPLAAARWRSATGARGLTAYAMDAAGDRWYTFSDGRAAGIDRSFQVEHAFDMPIWGGGALRSMIGHRLTLAEPRVAADGSLSAQSSGATKTAMPSLDAIVQSSAVHRNWASLRCDLAARIGRGVRRRAVALPALIAPTGFGKIGFDELHQCYQWQLSDDCNQPLLLRLPAEQDSMAIALWRMSGRIRALVCECTLENRQLQLRPVSVISEVKGAIEVVSVDFDPPPVERGFRRMMTNWRERIAEPLQISHGVDNAIGRLLVDVADQLAIVVENGPAGDLAPLFARLEASGLSVLHDALSQATRSTELRSVLVASYILSELWFAETLGAVQSTNPDTL